MFEIIYSFIAMSFWNTFQLQATNSGLFIYLLFIFTNSGLNKEGGIFLTYQAV